jgi:phosphoenolpyruvate carboxykinase (ATP)
MDTAVGIEGHGIQNVNMIYWNLSTPALYEHAIRRGEGLLAHLGPLVVRTGSYTGRSPNDKFIVKEPSCAEKVWWGPANQPISEEKFAVLYSRLMAYLQGRDIFIADVHAGTDPQYRLPLRVITVQAWHNLFARNMFVRPHDTKRSEHVPRFTVISAPGFKANPDVDGTRSETFIVVHFGKGLIIIGGTSYAGEIKKSIFTVMNYLLPQDDVLSMHCSANMGPDGDVALFFGLSGTGKTTLSASADRKLIGDDEHGWSNNGIFNFEGGCYAKAIRLSKDDEPEIYETTRRFGTILENVAIDAQTRRIDLNDESLTENTRAAYPISHISNALREGIGGHPNNVIFLTCDAFGVLPPVSKLTPDQARYYFLTGYTAKVAGTERGGPQEPKATFSTCFGAPFMALHPTVYSILLGQKIEKHNVQCWLVNTGWTKGPYGVGHRFPIKYTRAIIRAIHSGELKHSEMAEHPIFGLNVPTSVRDVPDELMNQRNTWPSPDDYDKKAIELAGAFHKSFEEYRESVPPEVREAGPKI